MLSADAETINVSIRPRKEILFYSLMIFLVNLSLFFYLSLPFFYSFYPMAMASIYLQHTIHPPPTPPTGTRLLAICLSVLSVSLSVHWLLSSSALLLGQIETTYIPIFCSIPFPPVPLLISLLPFH